MLVVALFNPPQGCPPSLREPGAGAFTPVQRPHPPLWYGTRTLAKAQWCARLGMPMMALVPSRAVRALTDAYKAEWTSLGRAAEDLPPLGISRNLVLAPTSQEAMKIANRAFARFKDSL